MFLNKAFIIGNLTRDPELKTLPSGTQVASFGVATNRVFRDREGNSKEDTQFHNIVVFGKTADNIYQYLKKGSSVLIEGRIQNRSWDAPDGTKRYRSEVVADRVQFGPRRQGAGGQAPAQAPSDSLAPSAPSRGKGNAKEKDELETINYPEEEVNPDDIPF